MIHSKYYNENRLINPRLPLLTAIAFCLAVFMSVNLALKNYRIFVIVLIVLLCFILFSVALYNVNKFKLILASILIFSSVVGILVTAGALASWKNVPDFDTQEEVLCVSIKERRTYESFTLFYAENLIIGGKKINGTAEVFINNGGYESVINFKAGDGLKLKDAVIQKNEIVSDEVNANAYKENCKYSITVDNKNVSITKNVSPGFFTKIRISIHNMLYANMNFENAAIAYSLITGDSAGLDGDIKFNFKITALSHVLAVSGLHITLIIAILKLLLDKIRINNFIKLFIIAAILIFYSGICYFSPSAMRALIMGLCSYLAFCLKERSDSLNNISIAAVMILLFKPLYLWHLSFILSFISALSIILLVKPIQKLLKRCRVPDFIKSPAALSIAAIIGLLPIIANVFGYFSLLFLITNFLSIPLVFVAYTVVLISVLICPLLPFMSFLFQISNSLIFILKSFLEVFISNDFAVIMLFNMSSAFVVYFFAVILLSGYILYGDGHKKTVLIKSGLCLVLVSLIIVMNIPSVAKDNSVSNSFISYQNYALISTENNERILTGEIDSNNLYDIEKYLLSLKIRKINSIILTNRVKNIDNLKYFAKKFSVDSFYFLDYQSGYDAIIGKYIKEYDITDVKSGSVYKLGNNSFFAVENKSNQKCGVLFEIDGSSILYINKPVSNINLKADYNINRVKVLITYYKNVNGVEYDYLLCQNSESVPFSYLKPNTKAGERQSVVLKG